MAPEENVYGCSFSGGRGGGSGSGGGGICRSKKMKPKKVPQRGLGVAQLEKIISEEQQKESANVLAPTDAAASFLAAQNFRPILPPFHNSVPPPSSPSDVSSPNALFRHARSAPSIEMLQESCAVLNPGGGEMDSFPRSWGGEPNLSVEKQRLDHHGFAFEYPHGNHLPQRSLHFQPPPPPSMVQSGISPSSVLSSHLEPPSNQSTHLNNYAPQWTDEDKMVRMKRPYPFSLETPPPPSLLCNFRPNYGSSSSRPDDLALCSSGYTYTSVADSRNKCIRGSDESLKGDFLTLAPPSTASPSSKSKHFHSDYDSRSSQEYERRQIHHPESSGSARQSFNFFPTDPNTNTNGVRNDSEEEGDTVDLSLKL